MASPLAPLTTHVSKSPRRQLRWAFHSRRAHFVISGFDSPEVAAHEAAEMFGPCRSADGMGARSASERFSNDPLCIGRYVTPQQLIHAAHPGQPQYRRYL